MTPSRVTICDFPDYVIMIETGGNMDEVMRVKSLPGRDYDPTHTCWVVPIRPGLALALERAGYAVEVIEPVRVLETAFMNLIEPAFLEPINMNEVTAAQALELAVMYHFYKVHGGDKKDYARIHAPFQIGE